MVPLQSLEDKVVGLYFYQDYRKLTSEILKAYKQLAQEKNFEIVLVYVHDAFHTFHRTSEDSYWKTFKEMPWLALPFKDLACKKLQRVFNYPLFTDQDDDGPDRSLVIIGPRGKFIELYGADILKKYGISAYPFTRQRVAKLEAECIQELKLNMFWTPKTTFIQKDGSMVQLSELELVGKRIIVLIEDDRYTPDAKFWRMLRARYLQVKGTDNEFEVIHICKNKKAYSYGKNIAPVSWLRHPSGNPSHRRPNIVTEILSRVFRGNVVGLFAFEHDGRVVRRTLFPSIEEGNLDFPFGDLEKEFLRELVDKFEWDL